MIDIHPKFIDVGAGNELVVLTREEFDRLYLLAAEAEEDEADVLMYDQRKAELENSVHSHLPQEVSALLLRGDRLIKALRKWRGLSQSQLAEATNLAQGYISDLESGRRSGTQETLKLIASKLDVEPSWLMDDKG
jgi:DNA-binding transcriptional regulator YiaG